LALIEKLGHKFQILGSRIDCAGSQLPSWPERFTSKATVRHKAGCFPLAAIDGGDNNVSLGRPHRKRALLAARRDASDTDFFGRRDFANAGLSASDAA
jgi:hypothetical protein